MAVDPDSVSKDKCYVTESDQVRHVIDVTESDVTYESRGKKHQPFPWGSKLTVNKEKFANDVKKEVPYHYDPNFGPAA